MTTIFVTSSTKKMYDFSGKKLVSSFLKYQKNNTLVYLTENFKLDSNHSNIIEYDIVKYPFLLNWLDKYKDIIPLQFGGQYDYNKDKDALKKGLYPKKTKDWNYKCSLWFRKIASLHYVRNNCMSNDIDKIIWIDNDCEIKSEINDSFIKKIFNNKSMFYFLGDRRKSMDFGVESGFIGWNNTDNFIFLEILFEYYINGKFKKLKRWDDGYIIKYILENDLKKYGNDIAKGSSLINVMEIDTIKKYIVHHKGVHWKKNIDY